MPHQQGFPAECRSDDAHAKMAAAVARAGVADMFVALILDIEFAGLQLLQTRADTLHTSRWSRLAHGSTFLNGRTCTSR